jgi:hypothetical protein
VDARQPQTSFRSLLTLDCVAAHDEQTLRALMVQVIDAGLLVALFGREKHGTAG